MENMKKRIIIPIACFLYIVLLVAIYYGVNSIVDKEVDRLSELAKENLDSFFADKPMYVDLHCNNSFGYKQVQIPHPEEPEMDFIGYINNPDSTLKEEEKERQRLKIVWEKEYGDITRLYELNILPPDVSDPESFFNRGWTLKVVCKRPKWEQWGPDIEIYCIFPKQVAYKKISPFLESSTPSVETAVRESLDFAIKNDKSDWSLYYERGSTYNLIPKMEAAVNNKYYYLGQDELGTLRYGAYGREYSSVEWGGMHNGYYKVNYHRTQPVTYSIRYKGDDVVQKDKYRLMVIYMGLLTMIGVGIIVFITKKK